MKKIILAVFFLITIFSAKAQNGDLLIAFEKSYANEKKVDYPKAIANITSVYSSHQSNYEINLRLGWLYYLSANYKDSNTYYAKALALKPMSLEAIFGNILPLLAQGKYNSIEALAKKALAIAPNDSKAEYYLGVANYYQKDYLKSERYLEKAINQYPFDVDLNLMLGWTKIALGKISEAKALFQVAQRHSPYSNEVKTAIDFINKK